MIRIHSITPPLLEIPYLNAGTGGGGYFEDRLPVHRGVVDRLPTGCSALVVTADLQGRERFQDRPSPALGPPRLLGEALPARLREEILPALDVPGESAAALLAGDFYTVPLLDRRGGTGDVTKVWQCFADHFQWIAGVAGNHDTFGSRPTPQVRGAAFYLDGAAAAFGELRIAGLGGIIGNPRKHQRRTDDAYFHAVERLLGERPDILLTHEGPDAPGRPWRGSPGLRALVEAGGPVLSIRGHAHWPAPLSDLGGGSQVLNVDARVVVLTAAG